MTTVAPQLSGLAPVNGLQVYFESYGEGGVPLIVLHGGYGMTGMLGDLPSALADGRRVIAVDLQGHGRTGDIDRPLAFAAMGDDIAALSKFLGLDEVDLMGYSLGGGVALRTAIDHPALIRRLVLVSAPYRSSGWYPDICEQMKQMDASAFQMLRQTPMYQAYRAVAPDPDAFPELVDKMGALLRQDYDWAEGVERLPMPTLLTFGDADSIPPAHAAEFFALLGGGQGDGGWDGSGMSPAQLAILPRTTHFTSITSPILVPIVDAFLRG